MVGMAGKHSNSRVTCGDGVGHLHGGIGRTVIDHEDFDLAWALGQVREQRLQGTGEPLGFRCSKAGPQ
jgi:hypothetical protein